MLLGLECVGASAAPAAMAAQKRSAQCEALENVAGHVYAELMTEVISATTYLALGESWQKRNTEHTRRVTETLRARSARRLGPVVPDVVGRPTTGVAAMTQQSINHTTRQAACIERNEDLTQKRKPSQLEELNPRLCLERMDRDQAAVSHIGACIARKKANNTRKEIGANPRTRREISACVVNMTRPWPP